MLAGFESSAVYQEFFIETEFSAESQPEGLSAVAAPWHTVLVLIVIAGLAWRGRMRADELRAAASVDRITLYARTILSEWLQLVLVLVGVWQHGSSLSSVLGERWHSYRQFLRDLGIGLLFLVVAITVTSILSGHQGGADRATQFLLPQGGAEKMLWIVVAISAGICEEAIFRGYLQRQFMALTRSVPGGIALSGLAFGAAHLYQGVGRAAVIAVLGVMGGMVAYWCRSVRPGMIAHMLQDTLGGMLRH